MSYSWFRQGTCTVNNSDTVRFQSANITTAPNKPVVGDAFIVSGGKLYEIIFIGSDATGEYIKLNTAYAEASASNINYAIARFASGTQNAKLVAMASAAINQKQISLDDMYEWYTSTADTVDFLGPDGEINTLTTYFKLKEELSNVGSNAGAISTVANNIALVADVGNNMDDIQNVSGNMAEVKLVNLNAVGMSQAQFEAIRAQNNEEYAASGFVHFGKHYNVAAHLNEINEGLWTAEDSPNQLRIGRGADSLGLSKTNFAVSNIAGVIFDIVGIGAVESGTSVIKLPQAPDGKTTYNKSTGANVVYTTTTAAFNAAAVDTNLEVVTDRVDMWGFESFLEEVNLTNPYIYPNGLIQSLATTMDGIATVSSNRPVTYYAWFNGDTSSKGKGVNYFTLTDAQKRKVLANYKNKLYFLDDGRLVQWRVRGRSFAGAGNGDWPRIESQGAQWSYPSLASTPNTRVRAQGINDIAQPYGDSSFSGSQFRAYESSANAFPHNGLFTALQDGNQFSLSANSECYLLVCGTINRLNKGAYHPSFNPSGAKLVKNEADNNHGYWYEPTVNVLTSKASAFALASIVALSGSIGGVSGRPDGRYYDAVYASGQGGVCRDMRYSANHTTLEKFSEADSKVKNGTYRGFEKIVRTKFFNNAYIGYFAAENPSHALITVSPGGTGGALPMYENGLVAGYPIIMYQPATGNILYGSVSTSSGYVRVSPYPYNRGVGVHNYPQFSNDTGDPWYTAKVEDVKSSVGGSFMKTDVIGNPANILLSDALKDGWEGDWLGTGEGSGPLDTSLSRKAISTQVVTVYSLNNGTSWSTTSSEFNFITNKFIVGLNNSLLSVNQYQAFAKQTEPTINTKVYGSTSGLGGVYSNARYATTKGTLLGESLINKICISGNQTSIQSRTLALHSFSIWENGLLSQDSFEDAEHSVLNFGPPTDYSPAFKALNYNTETNLQAGINYAATELKWDGTDWGDDSRIHIVNNANTLIDLNGNAVRVVTHKLKEPIGWIKNTI